MKKWFVVLAGLLVTACYQTRTDKPLAATHVREPEPLYANRIVRRFSDPIQPDTLSVAVQGESILTGEVCLRITNQSGQLVYLSRFPANGLLNHNGLIDPKRDERAVKTRIDDFFDPTHFATTAGGTDDAAPAVRFSYPVGKDSLVRIGYSESLRKVVPQ